ncbi:hypothetical protein EJ08DRAFT_597633 [Tothia fuscella]|uniref:SWIRM domain-containing protein n=1 Tax=Tothia fuscella TaxID=1048955 RepID=A0A9P4NH58_9PEZI|nr:hypothetical protein EJ08DRAFT_597633 [Tothia fuscella]
MDQSSHSNGANSLNSEKTPVKSHEFTIHSLLSPPESKRSYSFNSPESVVMSRTPSASFPVPNFESATKPQPILAAPMPSPPISPMTQVVRKEDMDTQEAEGTQDPPMFPRTNSTLSENTASLFPESAMEIDSQAVIAEHIARKGPEEVCATESEYDIVLQVLGSITFRDNVVASFKKNPTEWWKRERRLEEHYKNCGPKKRTTMYQNIAPRPDDFYYYSAGIRKREPKLKIRAQPKPRQRAPPKPRVSVVHDSLSPLPSPPPTKPKKEGADQDFMSIEDICPPTDGITRKQLKADWKGTFLDVRNDPNAYLLADAEIELAGTLRLTPATYLCSKRRIFLGAREFFLAGRPFRKTNAQQFTNIDVNKASKLWAAFERVGWFKDEHFEKFRN